MDYIEYLFARRRLESTVGVKLLYFHVQEDYAARWEIDTIPHIFHYLVEDKRIRIIHLKRRNRLRTLTSRRIAEKTRQWVLNDEQQRELRHVIELSPYECETDFRQIGKWEEEFDTLFNQHRKTVVYYEDLVCNRTQECSRVLDFLGVRQRTLQTDMLKQNAPSLPTLINNYHALKVHFIGNEWEGYFTE